MPLNYSPTPWVAGLDHRRNAGSSTAITATRLNKLEQGVKAVSDAVDAGVGGGVGLVEDPSDPGFFVADGSIVPPSNFAPSVTLGVSQSDLTVTASFTGSDPDDDTLTYSIAWGDGVTTSPATSPSEHTYAAGGAYTIVCTVSDGALTGSDSAAVTVTPSTGPGFGSTVLADGPISAFLMQETVWPILDSKGVMTAAHATGNTVGVGENQAVGSVSRCIFFGSTAPYLNLTPNAGIMDGWTAFTIELLIRPDRVDGSRFFSVKDDNGSNRSYRFGMNGGKLYFGFHGAGSSTASATAVTAMVANQDYHVAVTFDGTTARFYLNGLADGTASRTGAVPTFDIPHRVGFRVGTEFFRGWMAGLAYYNKVLTPTQISDHAASAGVLA